MLRELDAWALLRQHCGPLRDADWVGRGYLRCFDWADAVCQQVDIIAQPVASERHSPPAVGARLRLALAVAHAVSCCRGFEPASQQLSWRRTVETLWRGDRGVTIVPDDSASTETTFAHVGIDWRSTSQADDAFWMGFFHGDAASRATLAAVLTALQPHFPAASLPPPLRVSLSRCSVGASPASGTATETDCVVPQAALHTILSAALSSSKRTWPVATHLGLVVECNVDEDDSTAMRTTLALLRRAQLRPHTTIDRLTIHLGPQRGPQATHQPGQLVSRARALGQFLHAVVLGTDPRARVPPVETVALLGCAGASASDVRLVGALLSAVALASPPISELRCDGLLDTTAPSPDGNPLLLAWLAFALHCRRRAGSSAPPLSLSVRSRGVTISEQDGVYVETLVNEETPLRGVVTQALRGSSDGGDEDLPHVEFLLLGSTARLAVHTRLYYEPMSVAAECEAVTLWAVEDVDTVAYVAHKEGLVGVVYAGYGLVWTSASCVVSCEPGSSGRNADSLTSAEDKEAVGFALSSLELCFKDPPSAATDLEESPSPLSHRITAILSLLTCNALAALSLDCAVVTRDDLALVLARCRRLESLVLDRCVVESVEPLVEAYMATQQERARIAKLSLLDMRGTCGALDEIDGSAPEAMAALMDALTCGAARGVLRELYVDCRFIEGDERELITQLARGVAGGTITVSRLHVTCHRQVLDACGALLGPLRDVAMADPPRVRRAVLSVWRKFARGAADELARRVLALAEGAVVRTITWDADPSN